MRLRSAFIRTPFLFAVLISAFLANSCQDTHSAPEDLEYHYLPLKKITVGFKVDSVWYTNAKADSFTVYEFWVPDSLYVANPAGDSVLTGAIMVADSLNTPPAKRRYKGSFSWVKTGSHARLVLGGFHHIYLIFKPLEGKRWNAHAYDNRSEEMWSVKTRLASFQPPAHPHTFTQVIPTAMDGISNLIREKQHRIFWAPGSGLVHQESLDLNKDLATGNIMDGVRIRRTQLP